MAKKRKSVIMGLIDSAKSAKAPTDETAAAMPEGDLLTLPDFMSAQPEDPAATPERNNGLTEREFEIMVAGIFRYQGYTVTETKADLDTVVNLELRAADQLYVVQCEHSNKLIGADDVTGLAGEVAMFEATGGFLVTAGTFTDAAKDELATQGKVFLVDGRTLKSMAAEVANRPDLAPLD